MTALAGRPAGVSTRRRLTDHVATVAAWAAFAAAAIPLVSLLVTVVTRGLARLDMTFFTSSMRGIVGAGGGAAHALWGTVLVTLAATAISVPIGVGTAVYLVEYGRPVLSRLLWFLVDVMTGLPSVVAGLAAYALIVMVVGPGARSGLAGAIALSLLMIPVVVKSSAEMLRLVPTDLREAATGLGASRPAVIATVGLPAARPGIVAGVMLGVGRIIGETAPLLLVAGFTDSLNLNLTTGRMATLPVYIYSQWQNKGADQAAYDNRAWTAALVLIGLVLLFSLAARLLGRLLAPTSLKG
ncbi:MAG: phosphate ABC transporter permease PstA [Propionibacteriaceae bacterium]|jgi:phosphate transport system permease protein|nr:phosphate ABC transporter permease PstA [Propionibacteriaceae bacterium]